MKVAAQSFEFSVLSFEFSLLQISILNSPSVERTRIKSCGRDARTTKNRHDGIVVRASRPHIADAGLVPFRNSMLNIAGGSVLSQDAAYSDVSEWPLAGDPRLRPHPLPSAGVEF